MVFVRKNLIRISAKNTWVRNAVFVVNKRQVYVEKHLSLYVVSLLVIVVNTHTQYLIREVGDVPIR